MSKYMIYESAVQSAISNVSKVDDSIRFTAILQRANYQNRNGRVYPKDVLDEGINAPIFKEKLRTKTLWGEAGHPISTDLTTQTTINLRNIAVLIEEIWWDGDLLMGRCKTASTAAGRDMAGVIRDGSVVSFSLRAQGNVIEDRIRGTKVVQRPISIIGWDWVWLPSNHDAYMTSISESTMNIMYNYNAYGNDKVMALNESTNLFENGALINLSGETVKDKPVVDYLTSTINRQKKYLNESEVYKYSKNDTVLTMNENKTVLESTTSKKIVSTKEYILKTLRESLLEEIGDIAPIASLQGPVVRPLVPGQRDIETVVPDVKAEDVVDSLESGIDIDNTKLQQESVEEVVVEKECDCKKDDVLADLDIGINMDNKEEIQHEAVTEPVSAMEDTLEDKGIDEPGVAGEEDETSEDSDKEVYENIEDTLSEAISRIKLLREVK